ncbi:signal recognition particle-docking protein FtsY [Phyllobacterium sp. SYP-B3895]|uniref:signal recognition particle-docking protein FtsY n=1 Tax=Phyllobacterium sp. SYP-B3895 TaxID=2663240 RepID=UPI0012997A49|nr:signal recognition particle-docking protein FtsY [Phyllobacterium sp. SYP-B3895]MRG54776.1 signal recognition particle-docking protein FtsY [Phyllobacterium sp. SYP-B3895]
MALGFIKKIFSFGKKEVEEVSAEAAEAQESLAAPADDTVASAPSVEEAVEEAAVLPAEALGAIEVESPVADGPATAPETVAESEPEILPEIAPVVVEQVEAVAEATDRAEPEQISAFEPPAVAAESEPVPEEPEPEPEAADDPSGIAIEMIPGPMDDADIEPVEIPAPEAPTADIEPEEATETPAPAPVAKPSGNKVTVTRFVEDKKPDEPLPAEPARRLSWFERLRKGLSRSSQQLGDSIGGIFTKRKLDEDTLQDLEDVLIQADLGMETAMRVTDALSATRYGKDISTDEVRTIMATEIEKVLGPVAKPLELDLSHKPHVILVVGVNGTGKTTTIGKLAAKLTAGGLNVMLAAGDTFRAAAIEQLHIWGKRTGAPVVSSKLGADAAGLAFDAWKQAKEAGSDVLIIDTAGRLQNRAELMEELAKIVRVLGKHDPEAPHTVLQTLDATTGQNALNQVEIFKNIAGVNGLVMTKLDGTARGGILVAISAKHKLPVYFIGVGEQVDDLEPFAAKDFAKAIAGVA